MEQFKCFYKILEEALKGKIVVMRNYENDDDCVWSENDNVPPIWNEESKYEEWQGRVNCVLQNDNSHVDIIFEKDEHHRYPGKGYLEDCYNWHMNQYIKIIG